MKLVCGHVLVSLVITMAACGSDPAPARTMPATNTAVPAAPPVAAPAVPRAAPLALDEPTHTAAEAIARLGQFRETMCACHDRPCVDELSGKLTHWGLALSRDDQQEQPSDAQKQEMSNIVDAMSKCVAVVMKADTGAARPYASAGATAGAASSAPPPLGTAADALQHMGQFRDAMCKCTDKPCADGVTEQMTRWGQEAARSGRGSERITEDDTKAMAAITEEMIKCMTAAMTANTQPTTPAKPPRGRAPR